MLCNQLSSRPRERPHPRSAGGASKAAKRGWRSPHPANPCWWMRAGRPDSRRRAGMRTGSKPRCRPRVSSRFQQDLSAQTVAYGTPRPRRAPV